MRFTPMMTRMKCLLTIVWLCTLNACQFLLEDPLPICNQDIHCPNSQRCDLNLNQCVYIKLDFMATPNPIEDMVFTDYQVDMIKDNDQSIDMAVDQGIDMSVDMTFDFLPVQPTCEVLLDQVDLNTDYTARSPLLFCHKKMLIILTPDRNLTPNITSTMPMMDLDLDLIENTIDQDVMSISTGDQSLLDATLINDQDISDAFIPLDAFMPPANDTLVMYKLNHTNPDQLYWEPVCHNFEFSWTIQGVISYQNQNETTPIFTFIDPLYRYNSGETGLWELNLNHSGECPDSPQTSSLLSDSIPVFHHTPAQNYDLLYSKDANGKKLRVNDKQMTQTKSCYLSNELFPPQVQLWDFTFTQEVLAWIQYNPNVESLLPDTELVISNSALFNRQSSNRENCLINQYVSLGKTTHLTPQRRVQLTVKALDQKRLIFCHFGPDQTCRLHVWSNDRAFTSTNADVIYEQNSLTQLIASHDSFDALVNNIAYISTQVIDDGLSYQTINKVEILTPIQCTAELGRTCYNSGDTRILDRGWKLGEFKLFFNETEDPTLWWFKLNGDKWILSSERRSNR